jgi:hypothetical protein
MPYSSDEIKKALEKAKGLVYLAASFLGCSPQTIYNHFKLNPELAKIRQQKRNEILDIAESKLIKAVQKGESWAIVFLLKTQGQDRGYSPTGRGYLLSQIARAEADVIESINELTGAKSWDDALVMLKALSSAESNLRASLTALCLTPRAIAAARLKVGDKLAPEPERAGLSADDKALFEPRRG